MVALAKNEDNPKMKTTLKTSLAAKVTIAHCLQRRTAYNTSQKQIFKIIFFHPSSRIMRIIDDRENKREERKE